MRPFESAIEKLGIPTHDPMPCPDSRLRFPDGGQYRVEIPSTEGPSALRAVIEEASRRSVPFHRVSQGSGILLQTDDEIAEMCRMGREHGIEVNLFVGPRSTFDIGAQVYTAGGKALGLSPRGADQLRFALMDVKRACDLGLRSVLVSDIGVLKTVSQLRAADEFPRELIIKTSVMMAPTNPASARILEDLGANTINVPSDLTLPQLAGLRAAIGAVIDFYIEAPDNIGGFVRFYEMPEIARVAAPVYFKFGLRNSIDPYPSGGHLEQTVIAMSKERVRRAQIALDLLRRHTPSCKMSPPGVSEGLPAAV